MTEAEELEHTKQAIRADIAALEQLRRDVMERYRAFRVAHVYRRDEKGDRIALMITDLHYTTEGVVVEVS